MLLQSLRHLIGVHLRRPVVALPEVLPERVLDVPQVDVDDDGDGRGSNRAARRRRGPLGKLAEV